MASHNSYPFALDGRRRAQIVRHGARAEAQAVGQKRKGKTVDKGHAASDAIASLRRCDTQMAYWAAKRDALVAKQTHKTPARASKRHREPRLQLWSASALGSCG